MLQDALQSRVTDADRETIRRVREVLLNAGFTEAGTKSALGVRFFPGVRERRRSMPECLERVTDESPLHTFIRLFTLQQPVSLEIAQSAVVPMDLNEWERIGLVRIRGQQAFATVELCQYEDVFAAADWPGDAGKDVDDVMGLAASSQALIQMTVRRPVQEAFDLGTGCGIQAILAARHSRNVFGVDVNPRAVRFAEFNACLNETANIAFSVGDMFEPSAGRKFDLVLCNPPFVIGPKVLYTHTTTGLNSDHFCEAIVRKAPEHLTEGGFAQIVCNWAQIGDETSEGHVGLWLEKSGCDAWVLHSHTETAEAYTRARAAENAPEPEIADRLYDEWMAYFQTENITAVNFGLITMRRAEKASNWIRYDEIPGANGVCGKSIEIGFQLRDFLDSHRDDRQLLKTRLCSAPSLKFIKGQGNGSHATKTRIRLEEGLTFSATLDPEIADFIGSCKGETTLGDYARKVSSQRHIPMASILPSFLAVVRHLIELGFLLPVDLI